MWTSSQQVVDLVVRQTASKQTKLDLSIVHLAQRLAALIKRFEFLLYKLGCERTRSDRSPQQLHTCIFNSIHFRRKRVRACSGRPPNLILLHIQKKPTSRSLALNGLENFEHVFHIANDSPIIQIPHAKIQMRKIISDAQSQRMKHQREQEWAKRIS